jgi:hypothetical protein
MFVSGCEEETLFVCVLCEIGWQQTMSVAKGATSMQGKQEVGCCGTNIKCAI